MTMFTLRLQINWLNSPWWQHSKASVYGVSPAFGLNMEIHSLIHRIHSKCEKIQTRKTLNTKTFSPVIDVKGMMDLRSFRQYLGIKYFFNENIWPSFLITVVKRALTDQSLKFLQNNLKHVHDDNSSDIKNPCS